MKKIIIEYRTSVCTPIKNHKLFVVARITKQILDSEINNNFIRFRNRCIHVNTGIEMSEEYCDWTIRPDGVNLCTIACPGDCVLSGWSDWSLCPKVSLPVSTLL